MRCVEKSFRFICQDLFFGMTDTASRLYSLTVKFPSSPVFTLTVPRSGTLSTTVPMPSGVFTFFPTPGVFLISSSYTSCSNLRQHIRRPHAPEIFAELSERFCSFAKEGRTAERASADCESSDKFGFISESDLTEFDARAEDRSEILDQLTEVNAPFGGKVECQL